MAASRASYFLSKNNDALQRSLDRLSSGKKITQPADDAGGLAVSMKMQGSIDNLRGAANNVANALSFLQVQDGILDSAGQIVNRMAELQSLSTDVLKSTSDRATYEAEFNDLRSQLYDMTKSTFNSIALFGDWAKSDTTSATNGVLGTADNGATVSLDVAISSDGATKINIHRAKLGSALMVGTDGTSAATGLATTAGLAGNADTLQVDPDGAGTVIQASAFVKALENVALLRATNGGQAKRLMYAQDSIGTQISNMEAALGRILDVDIAAETTNLAKQQILVQASASMVSQANAANQVALMLLQ